MSNKRGFFEKQDIRTGKSPIHQRNALKLRDVSNNEIIQQNQINPVFTRPVKLQVLMKNLPDTYIVGGAVRDKILNPSEQPHDVDIVTSATPNEVNAMFKKSYDVGGQKYGTVIVLLSDEPKEVEVTTMRKDITGGRHPKVVFTKNIVEDLGRRDFKFNAMAMDKEGNIIDPHGGLKDIEQRVVSTIYDPHETLDIKTGDPLRAIRALRFSQRYDFEIEPGLQDAIRNADLSDLSGERIYMELEKMFEHDAVSALVYLKDYNILKKILPEIDVMKKCQHIPEHHPEGNCFEHTIRTLEFVQDEPMITKMAALLHDIGKPVVWVEGSTKYHGHDKAGMQIGEVVMKRLGRPKTERDAVVFVIKNHMKMHKLKDLKSVKRRALYDSPHFSILLKVVQADGSMRGFDPYEIQRYVESDVMTKTVSIKSLLDGHTIMQCGIPPGPIIKEIQNDIVEQQIEGHLTTKEQAMDYFRKKYIEQ